MKKNQGISLISLIITIIVIIILAAIVIFNGFSSLNSAQLADFASDCDAVYSAVFNRFSVLVQDHALSGDSRTNEQIYIEVARGEDPKQYATMNTDEAPESGTNAINTTSTDCQNIKNDDKVKGLLGLTLPKVREANDKWYVTSTGKVFNATGFVYTSDGKTRTYFTADLYADKELSSTATKARAEAIADAILAGTTGAITIEGE